MIEPTSFNESVPGLLIFEVDNMIFCTDVRIITVILKPEEIEWSHSMSNSENTSSIIFHDQDFKLLNFNKLMNLKRTKDINDSRVILLDVYEKRFAFFVDRVTEILSLDKIFIEKSIDYKPYSDIDFISGVLKFQGRICYFPDYERMAKELF